MKCSNEHKSNSEARFYTFKPEDDQLGNPGNSFARHAVLVVQNGSKWDYNPNEAVQFKNDPEYVEYRKCWNTKWQIVKDVMCGPDFHKSELLDTVCDV